VRLDLRFTIFYLILREGRIKKTEDRLRQSPSFVINCKSSQGKKDGSVVPVHVIHFARYEIRFTSDEIPLTEVALFAIFCQEKGKQA